MNSQNEPSDRVLAVLYCHVKGFEAAVTSLHTAKVGETLQNLFGAIAKVTNAHRGEVGPINGLGAWSIFESPVEALAAAYELERVRFSLCPTPISLSMALAAGPVFTATYAGQNLYQGEALKEAREVGSLMSDQGLVLTAAESYLQFASNEREFWWIDRVRCGDGSIVRVYEHYGLDSKEEMHFKAKWEYVLNEALQNYFSLRVEAALESFNAILEAAPPGCAGRRLLETYRTRCEDRIRRTGQSDYLLHLQRAGALDGDLPQ